jgi:hypothetical protein
MARIIGDDRGRGAARGSARGGGNRLFPTRGARLLLVAELALAVVGAAVPAGAQGVTERVSVGPGGVQANGESFGPALSADGRFVAFISWASNLVPGDTNGVTDIFVHTR